MTNSIVLGRAVPRAVSNSYPLSSSYHQEGNEKEGQKGPPGGAAVRRAGEDLEAVL